jgi:hypothetical protein
MGNGHLTLKEILRLSISEPINWLAGAGSEMRPAGWVTNSIEEAGPGDILLLPASQLNSQIIRRASLQGAPAVLLVGNCASLKKAPDNDLAIACIPG